jgi:tRNA-binding protein
MDKTVTIAPSVFEMIDVRVGIIRSADPAEGCRSPAYKLTVDLGPEIGCLKSIAQATHYPADSLVGKQVLAVINLKPRQVGKHVSEVLVLGVPTEAAGTALIVPDFPSFPGARLF